MANGTIAFDTLSTSGQITGTAKSVDTDFVVNGSAKAWANLKGTDTFDLKDNFNVGTATDDGEGTYTFNFSSSLSNTTYSGVVSCDDSTTSRAFAQSKTFTTSSFVAVIKRGDTGAVADKDIVSATVHGDLA